MCGEFTGEFPAQRASNAKMFPFDDVILYSQHSSWRIGNVRSQGINNDAILPQNSDVSNRRVKSSWLNSSKCICKRYSNNTASIPAKLRTAIFLANGSLWSQFAIHRSAASALWTGGGFILREISDWSQGMRRLCETHPSFFTVTAPASRLFLRWIVLVISKLDINGLKNTAFVRGIHISLQKGAVVQEAWPYRVIILTHGRKCTTGLR